MKAVVMITKRIEQITGCSKEEASKIARDVVAKQTIGAISEGSSDQIARATTQHTLQAA